MFDTRYSMLLARLLLITPVASISCDCVAAPSRGDLIGPGQQYSVSLADSFARLIEQAIPREYEKRKDWGQTKNITVGLRNDGLRLHRRKKRVKHGTWKHYKIRLVDPKETVDSTETLDIEINNIRPAEAGRLGFTLVIKAKFDLWARVKVYRYGVHLIALEIVGDAAIDLALDCEIGFRLKTHAGTAGVAFDPRVADARLDITAFHLHRISNANGPLLQELGEEFPRLIERELQGPQLVAKLNRAIDKKRHRLELSFSDLLNASPD